MRVLLVLLAAMMLAQCAGNQRFEVGESERALVFVGVAEAADATESHYAMLWRRLDPGSGAFTPYDDTDAFEAETNSNRSLRIEGIPGEFYALEIAPGAYALDSVFGRLRDGRVDQSVGGRVVSEVLLSRDADACTLQCVCLERCRIVLAPGWR